jgi:hypothetical protein
MNLENNLREKRNLKKDYYLKGKIHLLHKLPILRKWIQKSPAFSSSKYAHIRENIPKISADELAEITSKGGKIYIFGLPKSGNVWLTNLITDVLGLEKDMVRFTHGGFSTNHFYNKNIFRGVCLTRDTRSIMVSLFHWSSTKGGRDKTCIFNDIEQFYFDYFISYTKFFNTWDQFEERLVGWGIPLIKYEKLRENPIDELERLFKRWRIIVSRDEIIRSVERNSIKNYQSGRVDVKREYIYSTHFSRGGEDHLDEIPGNVLSDMNQRYGEKLRRWGYKID